tara:strand:+ start:9189 stop:10424 length:1236 start_codon:yes stop_codon:yes gene_type:complete
MRKVDVNKLSRPGFHRLERKLYLRCYQGGSKAYVHRHRNYWILIGDFRKIDIDDAEAINDAILTALARGYDVDTIRSKIARREKLETLWDAEEEIKIEEPVVAEDRILFSRVATEWFNKNKSSWSRDKTVSQMWRMIEVYCFPYIGNMPVEDISTSDVIKCLAPIWLKKPETADRLMSKLKRIFEYAQSRKYCVFNPAVFSVDFELPRRAKTPRKDTARIDYVRAAHFWNEFNTKADPRSLSVQATKVLMLLCKTPMQVAQMNWMDLDLTNARWMIGSFSETELDLNMYTPIPPLALDILKKLKMETGNEPFVFYKQNKRSDTITEASIRHAIQNIWGKGLTPFGWLGTFKTWSHSTGYPQSLLEVYFHQSAFLNLSITERQEVYRQSRVMLTHWQDYLIGEAKVTERARL